MKILIVDTYYPAFLKSFYAQHPELQLEPYDIQWRALMDQCFGTADFYSANLHKLGHEAHEVAVNCDQLQAQWMEENTRLLKHISPRSISDERLTKYWQMAVLYAQVQHFKPDVIYVQDVNWLSDKFLRQLKLSVPLIVGQHATTNPTGRLSAYDLILSSLPNSVAFFRKQGVPSEYFRIGFESTILQRLQSLPTKWPVVHVGGYGPIHRERNELLEEVSKHVAVDFWGYGINNLPPGSTIRQRYHDEAWGLQMYNIRHNSLITLTGHISSVAENYANNMTLYEATGVGTCLVTDMKSNLPDLFDVDTEVVAYIGAEDCAEKVRYLLDHEGARAAIAKAGQERTLREHTYYHRMQELSDILNRYLAYPETATRSTFVARSFREECSRPLAPSKNYVSAQISKAVLNTEGVLRHSPLFPLARAAWRRLRTVVSPTSNSINYGHHLITEEQVTAELTNGWKSSTIPAQQLQLVNGELQRMYKGDVVPVFEIAADAVLATECQDPLIVEVGCASGYYNEVLSHLLKYQVNYLGIDYSPALLEQAAQYYPNVPFIAADATALPLPNKYCDILFSSALLMHVPDFKAAVRESVRLSHSWCIFHRTPVISTGPTSPMSKYAYGLPVVELVFNEGDLLATLAQNGAQIFKTFMIEQYEVEGLDEPVTMKTYVCRTVEWE